MQYTENYSLKLPGYGDNADVGDLNDNTTAIDALIHANRQIEAPAFSTETAYTAGDMVVYENVLYKFTADKAAGNWDSTKVTATNLADEVTDAAQSGGTEVEANPSAPATADLHKLKVDTTVYGIPDPTVTKTATGNPIEITDGADAPLVKCVTEITGSQDLHGYDKPWVGGAGKNKLPFFTETKTQSGCTVVPNDDGTYHFYGTATSANIIAYELTSFTFSGSYIFTSSVPSSSMGSVTVYMEAKSNPGTIIVLNNGDTFNAETNNLLRIAFYFVNGTTRDYPNVELMLRRENESSTFEPYSNICPITAYTEGEIEVSDGDGNTTTHTATFSQTIYQGNADFVGGSVGAEWVKAVFDGSSDEAWDFNDANQAFFCVNGLTTPFIDNAKNDFAVCNMAVQLRYNAVSGSEMMDGKFCIGMSGANNILYFKNTNFTSVSDFKTWLSTNNLEVAYELATPTTETITPTNLPIKSLFGYNHIESSTGEMEVEYITQTYQPIVDLIDEAATTEVYSTDEQEIGVWIDGSKLYKKTFTFTISQSGETITVADVSYIDQLVEMSGVLGNATMVPQVSRGSATAQTWANISSGNLIVFVGTSGDEKIGASHITLKYTKTSSNNRSLSKGPSEESVDKVDKVDDPTETIEEKEENAGESNSENER